MTARDWRLAVHSIVPRPDADGQKAGREVQQRGLAAAAWADDRDEFAGSDVQREFRHRVSLAVSNTTDTLSKMIEPGAGIATVALALVCVGFMAIFMVCSFTQARIISRRLRRLFPQHLLGLDLHVDDLLFEAEVDDLLQRRDA